MSPSKFFEAQLKELVQDCIYGQLHYRTWQRLGKSFVGEADIMELASLFFVSTAEAHINSCRVHLFRLLDDAKGSLSIRGLINFAEKNKNIFNGSVKEVKLEQLLIKHHKILNDLKPTIDNLLKHRKKHFIHKSKEYLQIGYKKLYEKYNSTYKDYENVLTNIGDILNDYRELFKDDRIVFSFIDEDKDFDKEVLLLKIVLLRGSMTFSVFLLHELLSRSRLFIRNNSDIILTFL